MPHLPIAEILILLLAMRNNRPFMRISRLFALTCVTLSAIGCASEWIKPVIAGSPACVMGRWDCYLGPPLSMSEFVFQLGAPVRLFLVPLIDLLAAVLLLIKPARTYIGLCLFSLVSLFLTGSSEATPYLFYNLGRGQYLHVFALAFLLCITFPLVFDELVKLHPGWTIDNYLPS